MGFLESKEAQRQRRVSVYREVAKSPRLSKILGRLQRIGEFYPESLQEHYRNTADALEKAYTYLEALKDRSCLKAS